MEKIKFFFNKIVGKNENTGYLPEETPPILQLLFYSLQTFIVSFPATVAVALIVGFDISVTLFGAGIATLCFTFMTKGKIPLYWGSSFSYISSILILFSLEEFSGLDQYGKIAIACGGIICSGLVNIIVGFIISKLGFDVIKKILPSSIVGSISAVIGLTLMGNAVSDFFSMGNYGLIVAIITLLCMILFSVYLKGFFQQVSILLGTIVGLFVSWFILNIFGIDLFRTLSNSYSSSFAIPHFVLPKFSLVAIMTLSLISFSTIPESVSHLFTVNKYINNLRVEKGLEENDLDKQIGKVLCCDGICDAVSGGLSAPGGTSYGENISAMAITKVYSSAVIIGGAILAILFSFYTPLAEFLYKLPLPLIGAVEMYMFGCIVVQGIGILSDGSVSFYSPKDIAVIAVIFCIGLGGVMSPNFNGMIPVFGVNFPCIALASIAGILLNIILSFNKKK